MVYDFSEVFLSNVKDEPNGPYNATNNGLIYFKNYLHKIKSEKSDTIILKPNILPTDYINEGLPVTNPAVCAAAADYLKQIGFKKIILAEGTTSSSDRNPDTFTGMKNHGFFEYIDKWEPIDLNKSKTGKWFEIYSPGTSGSEFEIELGLAHIIFKYPLISIAKFKTHDVLGLTLSVKNLMGAITRARYKSTGEEYSDLSRVKSFMHGYENKHPNELTREQNSTISKTALAVNINRLAKVIFPVFSIIDASPAMCGNGPMNGECKDCNLIIMSNDPVSADSIACELVGIEQDYIQYIKNLEYIGLGNASLANIKVVNGDLNEMRKKIGLFKKHKNFKYSKFNEYEIKTLRNLT